MDSCLRILSFAVSRLETAEHNRCLSCRWYVVCSWDLALVVCRSDSSKILASRLWSVRIL